MTARFSSAVENVETAEKRQRPTVSTVMEKRAVIDRTHS
jgi:hypothetical protein